MKAAPLALHNPEAVRKVLLAHGWEHGQADAMASRLGSAAVHLTEAHPALLERLVVHAGHQLGLDVLTGEDWALVAGSRARLRAFARPWAVPPELAGLAEVAGAVLAADPPPVWTTAKGPLALDRPAIMGILNVTPDSFSDGGRYTTLDAALEHADRLIQDGADLLDLGGESTRPGRPAPVPVEEELERVLPVLRAVVERHPGLLVSVDTTKAHVAEAALGEGAAVVNDVSGGRMDPALLGVAARGGAGLVLMHSRGTVTDMASYDHADYPDGVVGTVIRELQESVDRALQAGVPVDRIAVDPGLGFGKRVEQNLELLDQLESVSALGCPIVVGPSRKRFLGAVTGREVEDRDAATAVACALAFERGAHVFRVHDPRPVREALALAQAVRAGGPGPAVRV